MELRGKKKKYKELAHLIMLQDKRLAEVCGLSLAFAGISSSEKYAVIAKALSQSH